jgi:aminopeptidase-like protein
MFQQILSTISETFSGVVAKEHVAEISRYHRIQASPGFRQAAGYAQAILAAEGLRVETLRFPADGKTLYWGNLMPLEWEATDAELWRITPEGSRRKLADFRECKISLVQHSGGTPPQGLQAEIIALDDGTEAEHYQGLDVAGKVVLTSNSDLNRVRALAVDQRGAIGILYDGMLEMPPLRGRIDVPDARQYVSFWPTGDEKTCWGFSLSPRLSDELRQLLKKQSPDKPLRVWARVDARFVPDGHVEVVSALIPGKTDEEVLVVAHLCHPQPSANDNASGAGATLEIARTLRRLVAAGKLLQPKRGIRFLLVPEMTGTFAFLATRPERIAKTVAAINLDVVGQNQEICGSSFLIECLPQALASFADDLIVRLLEELIQETKSNAGQGGYALFRHAVTPFAGGSDHYILSDPSVGIPCPMLIQWPDRFYHTSLDTLDKVDPASLKRAGVLAGTYAYFIAQADTLETMWLGLEMVARFKGRLATAVQAILTKAMEDGREASLCQSLVALNRRVEYALERQVLALESLRRLSPTMDVTAFQKESTAFARAESEQGETALYAFASRLGIPALSLPPVQPRDEWEEKAAAIVPVRRFPGPVSLRDPLSRLRIEAPEEWYGYAKTHRQAARHLAVIALYWVDGQRTLLDIADAVEMESDQRPVEFLVKYFELLKKLGMMDDLASTLP